MLIIILDIECYYDYLKKSSFYFLNMKLCDYSFNLFEDYWHEDKDWHEG